MYNSAGIKRRFIKEAKSFDSLYDTGSMNPVIRFINRWLRKDIYERYLLTIDHVNKYLPKSILDVGCGSGRYGHILVKCGIKKYVGIDFSPHMIELAKESTKEKIKGVDIQWKCIDFKNYQNDELFDTIIAMGYFDYVKDTREILLRMKSLVRHSIVASFPSVSFLRNTIRKVRYIFKKCPVYFYDERIILFLAKDIGFSKVEVNKIKGQGMDYFVVFYV